MNMSPTSESIQKFKLALCLSVLLPLTAAMSAGAETVSIPLGQQAEAWNVETPKHGSRKAQVEERFGSPIEASGPVGDPPIYTWDYEQFTVYFESDHVIHSVAKFEPSNERESIEE